MAMSVGTAIGYLDLDTSKFQSALKTASSQLKGFTDSSKSTGDRITSLGSGLKTMGQNMTKYVTTPLTGLGTASVATAATFEKSMSQVAATMGITAEEINNGSESYKKLEQAALDMGATTQFSASEASEALNYLALAGYDVDKSVSTLPTVLNLAAAGGLDLAYASDLMTDAMSSLGLETSQAEGFVDQLAKTSQKSNTSVGQLGEAILTVGGTAKVLAGGTTEMNTALGILADNGIKGAEGGTALRNVILSLSAPTDKAAKTMKKMGLEVFDAQGNMRPLNEIFKDLDGTLSTMTQGEQTKVLSELFNKVDLKSVNALLSNSGERFNELSGYIDNVSGAASEMAKTMNNNLSGQLTLLKSGLEGAAISIGNALLPMVKDLVTWINNLVTWFNNLSPSMQTSIVMAAGLAAAIGPVLIIIGQMSTGIGVLASAFSLLSIAKLKDKAETIALHLLYAKDAVLKAASTAATYAQIAATTAWNVVCGVATAVTTALGAAIAFLTSPIGLVIVAITALIAIGVLLYKNWDTVKAKCKEIWEGTIKPLITNVTNAIKTVITTVWNGIKSFLTTIWNGIKTVATVVWEGIKTLIELRINATKAVITTVWNAIKTVTTTVWNGIKTVVSSVWSGIKSAVTTGVNNIKSVVTTAWNGIKSVTTTIWNGIKSAISSVWNGIKSAVTTGINAVKSVITSVWSGLKSLLVQPFEAAKSVIDGILGGISSAISKVTSAISGIKNAASNVADKVLGKSIQQQENQDIMPMNESFDLQYAKNLVYSDKMAKNSIAEGIVNITNSAKDMIGKNTTKLNNKDFSGNSVVINNTYNSPKPSSIRDLKKQDEILMRRLSMNLGF